MDSVHYVNGEQWIVTHPHDDMIHIYREGALVFAVKPGMIHVSEDVKLLTGGVPVSFDSQQCDKVLITDEKFMNQLAAYKWSNA